MIETKTMMANYLPVGDKFPNGTQKKKDSANFGIFKQNWLMIRNSWPRFRQYGPNDYLQGVPLNHDLALDIQILHASKSQFGLDDWFAGHRGGISGLAHIAFLLGYPNFRGPPWPQQDIANYRQAVEWIETQLRANKAHQTDDTRFWVYMPPV